MEAYASLEGIGEKGDHDDVDKDEKELCESYFKYLGQEGRLNRC